MGYLWDACPHKVEGYHNRGGGASSSTFLQMEMFYFFVEKR